MKTQFSILILGAALALPVKALADYHNLSAGYLHSNIANDIEGGPSHTGRLDGVNIKYRYEWGEPLSLIGSLSYMTANAYSHRVVETKLQEDLLYRYSAVSLTAGPAWRFNDYVSVYGVIGVNYDNYSFHAKQSTFKTGAAQAIGHSRSRLQRASFAYGAGVQINPVEHMIIDLGYEASRFNPDGLTLTRNSLLFGVGYRF